MGEPKVVRKHADVVAAATDPDTFSNRVSTRRAIPNSLDGAEHAAYRAVVDRYLTTERVVGEELQCRAHAAAILDGLPRGTTVLAVADLGVPYAVRAQSTWLGWPVGLEDVLVAWIAENRASVRSGDRDRMREVAEEFDGIVRELLEARRDAPTGDVTSQLMADRVDGRPLTDDEIVSILRNWTSGDLGSLAGSVGVLVHFLATHPDVQDELRGLAEPAALEAAVEEILRIDDPFLSNRRVATRDVTLGDEHFAAGDRLVLSWQQANRDREVFPDPDRYDPVGHASANLVFGVGPHVCPGRALTLMELRVVVEELLARTTRIELDPHRPAVRETPPAGGWADVPVVLHR